MGVHIKELNIETFRGIRNLDMKNLSHINIITGDNNAGKTSVLEIVNTLLAPFELQTWISLGGREKNLDMSVYEKINMLFDVNYKSKNIKYSIKDENDDIKTIEIIAKEDIIKDCGKSIENICKVYFKLNNEEIRKEKINNLRCKNVKYRNNYATNSINKVIYIPPGKHNTEIEYIDKIVSNENIYNESLEILKLFDNEIVDIIKENKKYEDGYSYKIKSKAKDEPILIDFYGDGIKKVILLIGSTLAAKDGILLIDEIEIAIHTSIMNKVFFWLVNKCNELNIQLFMTSHSEEAINKVLKCSPLMQENMRLITLYSNKDKTVSRVLDAKKAIRLKDDLGVELR